MAATKFSDSIVKEILSFHDQGHEPAEIANLLSVKKMQVCAILAYRQFKSRAKIGSDEFTAADEAVLAAPAQDNTEEQGQAVTVAADEGVEGRVATGILVGDDLEYDDPMYWDPRDTQAVQNPHLMIMGESGSGKTYAVQCLVAELAHQEIPSVTFDYGQSFELQNLETPFLKYTTPVEYLVGEEGVALNPLQIFPNDIHGPNAVATRLSDVFVT